MYFLKNTDGEKNVFLIKGHSCEMFGNL